MFYAASEIVFWILLAAIAGGGIGYGLAQAKSVRLNQRLTQSRADAPMERELAIAWDTIEDLNKRLQVAHETIRDTDAEDVPDSDSRAGLAAAAETPPAATADPAAADAAAAVVEMVAPKPKARAAASNGSTKAKKPIAGKTRTTGKTASKSAAKSAAKKTAAPTAAAPSDDTVGTRLSERVASASLANNQVDFTDGE